MADRIDEKTKLINEIYQSYLEKDIRFLLDIKKTGALTDLLRLLAAQSGSLINISEISSTLGIAAATVRNYLWYFEKTYIIKKVTPYHTNIRKEITRSPLYYFSDIGLKNFGAGDFGHVTPNRRGHLFENLVFTILQEKVEISSSNIHFWRTKDGAEVDFVIQSGNRVLPVEVKWKYITLVPKQLLRL